MKATLKNYLYAHSFQLVVALGTVSAALAGLMPAEAGLLPMMLLNTDGGAPAGGEGGNPTNTSSEAGGGGKPAPAAGDSGKPAPAAASADKPESNLPRQKGAVAHERAAARLDKARAAKPKPASDASAQQPKPGDAPAPGTEGKPGEGEKAAQPGAAKPGEEKPKAGDAPAAEIAKAPDNWTADRQEKFNALPPEARSIIADFHKDMSAGLTHALTQLSEERSQNQNLFALNERFNSGPEGAREVLDGLAKQANIELFFERPEADDTPPEDVLKDPKLYAKWIREKSVQDAEKLRKAETEKATKQAQAATAREQLAREFQDVSKAHTDFATHKPAVMQLLQKAPSLSVEEAYRVVTHDALVKLANEAPALKQQLATVTAELAALKKKATQLPAGGGPGAPTGEDKFLSPGARAMKRAEAKHASRGARV